MRRIVSDGTYAYVLNENGIQKITLADSTSVTFQPTRRFTCLLYANSTLYAADQGALYDIDPSTGVATLIGRVNGIEDLAMLDADEILLVNRSSIIRYKTTDETYTYIRKDVN